MHGVQHSRLRAPQRTEPVTEMVERTIAEYGQLNCLLNNAGTHISKTVFDQTETEWDRLIDINLKGYFLCAKAALPHLVAAKGNIINMSSMVGLVGQSRAVAYAASKGGIVAMTQALALDLTGGVVTRAAERWSNGQAVEAESDTATPQQ